MASTKSATAGPVLERIPHDANRTFSTPSKRINDGDDLTFFLSSTAYADLMTWLLQLNRSMFPTKDTDGKVQHSSLSSPPKYSKAVQSLRSLVSDLKTLIEKAPPDTGPRRFGNVAFRTWFEFFEDSADGLLDAHLAPILGKAGNERVAVKDELKVYLLGSFGSAQRLDYGTGHELSFLAFLGCLWKLNAFEDGEERAIVMGVVQPYIELIRHLVLTYTLEPAGSHGVWGLDDHSFIPYIFGSAQYGPAISPLDSVPTEGSVRPSPSPSKVADKATVADYKDTNMYFSAVQFIYDVKRGPFWEHSPVLYDISGIKDGWGKINKGMLKMWAAEVLGKFPVVQHFPFGSLFKWEADPEAVRKGASMHAQQQPVARSMDVPAPPAASSVGGTKAPWAKAGGAGTMPQMQAASGVPTMRAPWAGASRAARQATGSGRVAVTRGPAPSGMPQTAAPWASNQRVDPAAANMTSTSAPWARKNDQ
ncbi:Serine/threonine-protein phosphatase 2A activator 1 [Vermiconidia calcicola]|uniref:Serine/threonine-protein phosphatase 2A activator 1 n=1 Tax=Vermiconidia calcicola TaxID=1690605 RepID=A0ACC3MM81_9PEZI|nr:Serine/threonine-protein phosphatase 2A activator 1 [Vermiconidia calcicola]